MKSPKIIAEIGCNHKGDMAIAKEMIMTAATYCKVDVVKFQKRCNKELLTPEEYNAPHPHPENSYGKTYGEHREFLEFNLDQHRQLQEWCNEFGVEYSTSVWDITSAKEICTLHPNLIKVPSACNLNKGLLEYLCDNFGGEIHLSFGMTTRDEEEQIIRFFESKGRNKDLVIYDCTSGYPVPFEDICLLEITRLRELYADRAREITRAFCCDDFDGFNRPDGRFPLVYVCFKDYDESIPNKIVAFKKEEIDNTFGEYLAAHGKTQVRLAETEKYAHVTFFFNGGVEEPNKNEDRILVKSPAVATYDLQPEMSAPEVCEKLVDAIGSDKYDVIIINFANPDMVGHTGVIPAAIKAVETVDACVGKAVEAVKKADGVLFICADHGNAEQMINYETGEPHTAHTTNPVPFVLVNYDEGYGLREGGCLADIAPTLLEIMELPQPKEMTGKSLLIKK